LLCAEEVPARRNRGDGVEAEVVVREIDGAQERHHVLEDPDVDDQLPEGGREAAPEPACGVVELVAALHHHAPPCRVALWRGSPILWRPRVQ
jgi:hypothetical protein